MDGLRPIQAQLDRIEGKLDNHLERITRVESAHDSHLKTMKYLWILVLGAVGKLAHITFLK